MLINTRQVPISVAIVMPEIGLDDEPIKPTIRLDTVTKKKPNTTTSIPSSNLFVSVCPGICGKISISTTKSMLPIITVLIDKSSSVRLMRMFSPAVLFTDARLDLKDDIMVGMVLINGWIQVTNATS